MTKKLINQQKKYPWGLGDRQFMSKGSPWPLLHCCLSSQPLYMPGYELATCRSTSGFLMCMICGNTNSSVPCNWCSSLVGFKCVQQILSVAGARREKTALKHQQDKARAINHSSAHLPSRELPPRAQCCGEQTLKQSVPSITVRWRSSCRCKLFCFWLCMGHWDLVLLETPKTQKLALYRAPRE